MIDPTRQFIGVGFALLLLWSPAAGQVVVAPGGYATIGRVERLEKPPGRMLGTFYPDTMANIMGSDPVRGGYAPLGMYGPTTMALYGPMSTYRVKTAPLVTYQRGYDGLVRPQLGVSMSYPNFPIASPVLYPTRANYFSHFPESGVPPTWRNSAYWLDQN